MKGSPGVGPTGVQATTPVRYGAGSLFLALWSLVVALTPWYAGSSGTPQPSDLLLVPLIVGVGLVYGWRWPSASRPALMWLGLFFIVAITVELSWSLVRQFDGYATRAAYIAFSAAVTMTVLTMVTELGERFTRRTAVVAALVLLVEAVAMAAGGRGQALRPSLWFNNSNQLGYHALASCCVMALCARRVQLPAWLLVAAGGAGAYLAAASKSKAAILGFVVLGAIVWFQASWRMRRLGLLAAMVVAFALAGPLARRTVVVSDTAARIRTLGRDSDDNLRARGYNRIWEYPEYLLVGAGDEEYGRFEKRPRRERPSQQVREGRGLHSSWGTILFAYGVTGAGSFTGFTGAAWLSTGTGPIALIAPMAVYGLTHYGLRESLFWVAVALVLASPAAPARRGSTPTQEVRGDGQPL